jgi:hypothetical protein
VGEYGTADHTSTKSPRPLQDAGSSCVRNPHIPVQP